MVEKVLEWLGIEFKAIHGTEDTNYMFCCPFHKERHPSCGISRSKLIGRCFSCGEVFHLAKLISHIKGYTYTQSSDFILEKFNIQKEIFIKSLRRYDDLMVKESNTKPITYLAQFNSGKVDTPYMYGRGFEREDIEQFKIGYDKKIHRVTIPIFNRFNSLMGVVGRSIYDEYPRYKVYDFKIREALFPLHKLEIKDDTLIIVEGLLDAMWLHKLGYKNTLSVMNAGITKEQVILLKGIDASKLLLALDNDIAGEKAQDKIYSLLKNDFKIDRVDYGTIKDFQGQKPEIIKNIINKNKPYIYKELKRMV